MRKALEDNTRTIRAEIEITSVSEDLYSGYIVNQSFTDDQINSIKEYEELVNNQAFSLLDKIESRIESFGFKLKNEETTIFDLQIWNMKDFSFRKLTNGK